MLSVARAMVRVAPSLQPRWRKPRASPAAVHRLARHLRNDSQTGNDTPGGTMLYHAYQDHDDLMWMPRAAAISAIPTLDEMRRALTDWRPLRRMAAALEVFALARLTHHRPDFDLPWVKVAGRDVRVHEEVHHRTPFGTLLHFRKE